MKISDIDGNFFTMPILAFVGKEISLSDKLSLNILELLEATPQSY